MIWFDAHTTSITLSLCGLLEWRINRLQKRIEKLEVLK